MIQRKHRDKDTDGARRKVRYAVVGLGHIAQVAVLPGFKHARRNSELGALVSGDARKLRTLGAKYGVARTWDYDRYADCLASGEVDAVYIALPNSHHREYAVAAAQAGVHVLCEKPLALSEEDCLAMIQACDESGVLLMTAYRLHFDAATIAAVELVRAGRLGEPRLFDSTFSMQVEDRDNIRLRRDTGGGPLWDIGIYCVNAARCLFRAEPTEALSLAAASADPRFDDVPEAAAAILRFPDDRLATFSCSFGAADVSSYRVVGERGDLRVEPAYEYAEGLKHVLTVNERVRRRTFPKRDQFGAELLYFSDCVLEGREPEPSGIEGLADVRVIRALQRSAEERAPVVLPAFDKPARPSRSQEIRLPPVRRVREVNAQAPSDD